MGWDVHNDSKKNVESVELEMIVTTSFSANGHSSRRSAVCVSSYFGGIQPNQSHKETVTLRAPTEVSQFTHLVFCLQL